MTYQNTKTGAIFDSPCIISGGDIVIYEEDKTPMVIEEPEEELEEESVDLSSMTIDELRILAEELGIDLGKATKKDDIIRIVAESVEGE